jgi:hypothetical protein
MAARDRAELADAPDHAVLAEPWTYAVEGLRVSFGHDDHLHNSLDLLLSRGGSRVCLQFAGVSRLEIDAGFPYSYMGLEIVDVSHLHWERINVRVQGYEPAPGIRFWASSVVKSENISGWNATNLST